MNKDWFFYHVDLSEVMYVLDEKEFQIYIKQLAWNSGVVKQ